jgi:hypothetical protein
VTHKWRKKKEANEAETEEKKKTWEIVIEGTN